MRTRRPPHVPSDPPTRKLSDLPRVKNRAAPGATNLVERRANAHGGSTPDRRASVTTPPRVPPRAGLHGSAASRHQARPTLQGPASRHQVLALATGVYGPASHRQVQARARLHGGASCHPVAARAGARGTGRIQGRQRADRQVASPGRAVIWPQEQSRAVQVAGPGRAIIRPQEQSRAVQVASPGRAIIQPQEQSRAVQIASQRRAIIPPPAQARAVQVASQGRAVIRPQERPRAVQVSHGRQGQAARGCRRHRLLRPACVPRGQGTHHPQMSASHIRPAPRSLRSRRKAKSGRSSPSGPQTPRTGDRPGIIGPM
jgi:hypothetical protein